MSWYDFNAQLLPTVNPRPHLLFRQPLTAPGTRIEIEIRNNNKRKDRDVLNLTIPDVTVLGHILTFTRQVKQKNVAFWKIKFFCKQL